jgi:glucose/arabinose dehydrogenase
MRVSLAAVGLCTLLAGCGGSSKPPDDGGRPPGDDSSITGTERLGWDQRANSNEELASYQFYAYVDDTRQSLTDVSCGALVATGSAPCSARLPPMTAGPHTLALAASGSTGLESARSEPLQVVVRTTGSLVFSDSAAGTTPVAAGVSGGRKVLRTIAAGLLEPTDLAATPDGRVLVAERHGTVRMIESGHIAGRSALSLDDVSTEAGGGLLGLALDPDFPRTRLVYAVYTAPTGFRVARFREVGGLLGERAVLLDGVARSANPAAAVRFGPDGKLYVAFDDHGDASTAGDLGTYSGKVLRLNADGTVPGDQSGLTPVFVPDVRQARALDWAPQGGALWIAEGAAPGSGVLDAVAEDGPGRRGRIGTRYALPDGHVPSSAAFYAGALMPEWTGDLLVALPEVAQVVRLRFDRADGTRVVSTEVVLNDEAGRIRALTAGPGGELYFANDNMLLALVPAALASSR